MSLPETNVLPEMSASNVWFTSYGLTFRSPFLLPGGVVIDPPVGACADVDIVYGPVSTRFPSGARYSSEYLIHGTEVRLNLPRIGRFSIDAGRRITIDAQRHTTLADLMVYLKGTVLAVLLHQRRAMPLHASCVARDGKAVAFVGEAAAGKSTTAALFSRHGFDLVCDDVLVHRADEAGIAVLPSDCSARLWYASSTALEMAGHADLSDPGAKQAIPIDPANPTSLQRLQAVFVLSWLFPASARAEIRTIPAFQALSRLRKNIYRDQLVAALDLEGRYMSMIANLISAVPVFILARSPDFSGVGDLPGLVADRVEV